MKRIKHPAKYTDVLLPVFEKMIPVGSFVLDPFAGVGKIHNLPFRTVGLEIEQEWASAHPDTICGDATKMPFQNDFFDVICTSPTYGNRMADSHNAQDGSRRNTYTHVLGRKLNENNSGKMQWGEKYKTFHEIAYKECKRVLKTDGLFILNIKNHIRSGVVIDVHAWHVSALVKLGFTLEETVKVSTPSNGFGQNGKSRVPYEYVTKFRLTNPIINKRLST